MTADKSREQHSDQGRVGQHGVAAPARRPPVLRSALLTVLTTALAIAVVPAVLARYHADPEVQAFAKPAATETASHSARAAFARANDALAQADKSEPEQAKADYTSHVGVILQNSVMTGGCEIVSLGIALQSMGLPADVKAIADAHLELDGHFATGYSGSPYSRGGGYPAGVAKAANSYLESLGADARARDLSGASFDDLRELVGNGYPVLVWTTMGFTEPHFTGIFDNGVEWYDNEHCVVLYGFEGDKALISDPLEGLVARDLARFADIYAKCGSMAIAVY